MKIHIKFDNLKDRNQFKKDLWLKRSLSIEELNLSLHLTQSRILCNSTYQIYDKDDNAYLYYNKKHWWNWYTYNEKLKTLIPLSLY